MKVYLDTSFLVPLYVKDLHSPQALQQMKLQPIAWLTPLNIAEFSHAIGRQMFLNKISPTQSHTLHRNLAADRTAGLWLEVAMPEQAFELCSELGRRWGPKIGIRPLDSLHVACALELKADQFWTFDERQKKLAKAVGLKTL